MHLRIPTVQATLELMNARWSLLLLVGLASCSMIPRPVMIENEARRPAQDDPDEIKAREALREIERRIDRGELPKIQFEFDKADITPESFPTLDLIAQLLISNGRLKLMIFAHTDIIGTDDYNVDLSLRRAKSVKAYLASKGAAPPSMRFHGYGSKKPMADNETDDGRAKNRRVEFYITTREWNAVY